MPVASIVSRAEGMLGPRFFRKPEEYDAFERVLAEGLKRCPSTQNEHPSTELSLVRPRTSATIRFRHEVRYQLSWQCVSISFSKLDANQMNGTNPPLSDDDVAEIERHKYFMSEKAGYDVGWEAAENDWKAQFADRSDGTCDPTLEAPIAGKIGIFLRRLLAKAGVL